MANQHRELQSILVVLLGSIGDVVRGLAVVAPIKQRYPNCKITWLVEPLCRPLVSLHPQIDRVITFQRSKPLRGILQLRAELRAERYDIALDMQRIFKSGFFSYLSGCSRRLGFNRLDAKEFNWIFQTEYIRARGEGIPKLDHYLEFCRSLGVEQPAIDFGLRVSGCSSNVESLLTDLRRPFVALLLGSSWESKNWPRSGYEGLLKKFAERSEYSVLLCGDKSQSDLACELTKSFPSVKSCVGRTSLEELLQILGQASLLIGPDSGPAHMAAALGVPCVTLFGPTNPKRVAPWGAQDYCLQSDIGCRSCYLRRCPGLGGLCMRLLSPELVFHTALQALQRSRA